MFFLGSSRVRTTVLMHQVNAEKAAIAQGYCNCNEQILEATSHKTVAVRPPTSHL